jgi:hypothetical protein
VALVDLGIRIGGVRFESNLPTGGLIDLYWKVIGWIVLLSFAMGAWFGMAYGIAYAMTDPAGTAEQKTCRCQQQLPVLIAGASAM